MTVCKTIKHYLKYTYDPFSDWSHLSTLRKTLWVKHFFLFKLIFRVCDISDIYLDDFIVLSYAKSES